MVQTTTKYLVTWLLLFSPFTVISQTTGDKERLLNVYKQKPDSLYTSRMSELAGIYYFEGNKDSALFFLEAALNVARKRDDAEGTCLIYGNMASIELYRRRIPRAMELYQEALQIAEKKKLRYLESSVLHNIGIVLFSEERYEDAATYYQRAVIIDLERKDTIGLIYNYSSLCNCFSDLGDTAQARLSCNNAEKLLNYKERSTSAIRLEQLRLEEIKRTLQINIANLLLNDKQYQEVIVRMMPYWNNRENIKDTVQYARLLGKLAAAYEGLGNFNQSLFFALKAEELIGSNKAEHWDACRDYYALQGRAYAAKGLYSEAYRVQKLYQEASDSFSTKEKNKRINELHTRYETEKKSGQIVSLRKEQRVYRLLVILAGFFALLAVGFLLQTRRSKKLQVAVYKQEQEIQQNRYETELAALEQTALRAQMNPHFIANALTSIHNMVAENDKKKSDAFISNFARLIRQTLENSTQTFIPLEEEIAFVQLFLELEQNRAQPSFDFEIITPPGFNTKEYSFPSMLLQPFLENCIQHAFVIPNKQPNRIQVSFVLDEYLTCEITDNGTGFQKNTAKKTITGIPQQPMGIALVQKRIEAINKRYAAKILLLITDIPETQTGLTGTRVQLRVPAELCC